MISLACLPFLLCLPQAVSAPQARAVSGAPVRAGKADLDPTERLVGLAAGADASAVAATVGAVVVEGFGDGVTSLGISGPASIERFRWESVSAAELGAAQLSTTPAVVFVEFNRMARLPETTGCATSAQVGPQQCTAAFVDTTPTLPEYVDQQAVPDLNLGAAPPVPPEGVTLVAVIDTGLDPSHPLLQGRFAGDGFDYVLDQPGGYDVPNGKDDDADGLVDEAYGHGTHVAGAIALVDPGARFLPYRVLDADGGGTAYDVAEAIYRAGQAGAQVINLSLGLAGPSAAVEAALDDLEDDEVIVFASAGNSGLPEVGWPARYESAVAVAAVGPDRLKADFSAYGAEVRLLAPGVDVYSAMPGGQWATWSGTSMACALASGAASRMKSLYYADLPESDDTEEALAAAAVSVDALQPGLLGLLGSGLVDVAATAVLLAADGG